MHINSNLRNLFILTIVNQLPLALIHNEVTRKLHEQGLITKNCIATHTDLIFKFNLALYSSAETFYNRKMFQAKVFYCKDEASIRYYVSVLWVVETAPSVPSMASTLSSMPGIHNMLYC